MQSQNAVFSIIIPTHNRVGLLMSAIQSVINQSIENWELIIVDDGSVDRTREKVNSLTDPRIHYYYQEHGGRCKSRNLGIAKASGRYICFLDDDDEYLPYHLEVFHQYLDNENYPSIILRSGFIKKVGEKKIRTPNYNPKKHNNPVRYAAYNMCGIGSICIPSEFLEMDQFPRSFPHWQDTHLILRLLSKYPFHQLDHYSYLYNLHETMGSKYVKSEEHLKYRADINVKAIEDLFNNYGYLIQKYLPQKTLRYLKSEKWIQYATLAKANNYKQVTKLFYRKSITSGVYLKLWKYYILLGIQF